MKTIRDTWLMYRRSLILTLRQPVWVAMGLFQPILYLLLFAPLLEGATSNAGATRQRVQLVHPGPAHPDGILRRGIRGLRPGGRDPVWRRRADAGDPDEPLCDAGRSVAPGRDDPARPVDAADPDRHPVRPEVDPVGAVLTLGIVALVGLTFSLLSYTLGLIFKSEDALAPVAQAVSLPLLLLSGIMLPMALAPDWLQTLSTLNPLTHAVDAARALFNGLWDDPQIVVGSVVMGTLALLSLWIASRAFARTNA